MTNSELKEEIKRDIDNEQDDAILKKLYAYYHKLKKAKEKVDRELDEKNKQAANDGV